MTVDVIARPDWIPEGTIISTPSFFPPVKSEWKCYLIGRPGDTGAYTFKPRERQEPNWFHRWAQYVIFGFYWTKED